ncbi:MAG: AmpG family muropeptide MFS transporter [Methylococcales symbiont of Hymedesmia sp. n. MRB-2018]|nr:MAG: AmpG family muropeptide MFS transporter [Methylococcales symbiont of Hymedesmia sp. n. MRB-2018]
MSITNPEKSLLTTLTAFSHPRVVTMLFLGISAGIPLLLIFSSLSLWLREAGIQREAVTYFSWAALGYSFKFVWAPLVDKMPLPLLSKLLGRRRAWLLLSQIMIILSIVAMAFIDPAKDTLTLMAWAAVCLGFSSATQDIVIDAYRIESADSNLQALMSSSYIAGYRIGMLLAGAGTLFLASYFGSTTETYDYHAWQSSYLLISGFMLIGVITTLTVAEPPQAIGNSLNTHKDHLGFLFLFIALVSAFIACFYYSTELAEKAKLIVSTLISNKPLVGFIIELFRLALALIIASIIGKCVILSGIVKQQIAVQTYMVPIQDFFQRYGYLLAWLLLALIGLYRISDIVLGVISNVFYQDLGFSKPEIASVVKSFGLAMTITGGFLGGLLAVRFGVMRILFLGALLSALTNLLFMVLAQAGHDMFMLYLVISADNLSAGLASAAFIAFLSSLTNISFTAVQYAIFSSLMTLLPKILGGYSGTLVETLGYSQFFLITAIMGIPVLLLIILAEKYFQLGTKL